jgi:isopentenyl phosphate kinase
MIFLKLGGSLITDKTKPLTSHIEIIQRLAAEIAAAWQADKELSLLIGHGSGSFGHFAASQTGTHQGAFTPQDWSGFITVADAARQLHQLVMRELINADLPAISFPPSTMLLTRDGEIVTYHSGPITQALQHGLMPVVHGDVAFDRSQGSAIVSTEQVFSALLSEFHPERVLLAGLEDGVLDSSGRTLPEITRSDLADLDFGDARGADVTGGMQAKVELALTWAESPNNADVMIFSATAPGQLKHVLLGGTAGTRIRS